MRQRTLAAALALALGAVLAIAAPALAHPVLNITASPTTVTAGSTTTITITGTSNGNYTNARIEVFASTPSSGGTTGMLTSFTSSPVCAGTPAAPACTENPSSRYRLGGINLANGQPFSYTLTVTVDAGTAAGTFTSKAQFYKSDNTTDGPRTGPLITVTSPSADIAVGPGMFPGTENLTEFYVQPLIVNNGPAVTTVALTYTVTQSGSLLTPNNVGGPSAGPYTTANGNCTISGTGFTCSPQTLLAGPQFGMLPHAVWNIGLLATGTFTITATATDPTPANNSASVTCSVSLGLLVSC